MAKKNSNSKTATAPAANAPKEYNLKAEGSQSPEAQAAAQEQQAAALSLVSTIATTGGVELSKLKLKRRGMPTLIKPDQIPVNSVVTAEIVEILPSPVSTVKGFLAHLKSDNGTEFTFPITGVIRNALAPGVRDNEKELKAALDAEVGKILVLKRLANKPSKFKKEMFVFDVFTAEK